MTQTPRQIHTGKAGIARGTATQATRIAVAHRAAAHLATSLLLNRVRRRASRRWEDAAGPLMPQLAWLAASEDGLLAWLDAGGFAGDGELPPANVGSGTKTAA